MRWPGVASAGDTSDYLSGFEDWMPTFCAAAGVEPSETDGVNLREVIAGEAVEPRDFLYREFPGYGGFQAVWSGPWKAIRTDLTRKNKQSSPIETELYNLEEDWSESMDVSGEHPDVVEKLERLMAREHTPSELFPMLRLDNGPATK